METSESGRSIAVSEVRVPMLNIMLANAIYEERRQEIERTIRHRRLLDDLRQRVAKAPNGAPSHTARQDRVPAAP